MTEQDQTYYIVTWWRTLSPASYGGQGEAGVVARESLGKARDFARTGPEALPNTERFRIIEMPSLREIPLEVEYEYLIDCVENDIAWPKVSADKITGRLKAWSSYPEVTIMRVHRREVGTTQWHPMSEDEIKALVES